MRVAARIVLSELAIAKHQAAIAQAEADRNLAIAEGVIGVGLVLFLI